jgi:hypothetical protein
MLLILEETNSSKKLTTMSMFLSEQKDIDYVNASFLMTQWIDVMKTSF